MAKASKAYVQHRVDSLRVKPTHTVLHTHRALHAPLCFLLSGPAAYKRGRAKMPSLVASGFLVVADVVLSVKLGEVVDDDSVALEL